jgi:hypothetical protein
VGSAPNADPYNTWRYLNGRRSPPASGIRDNSLTFVAPSVPGLYELRLFEANTYKILEVSDPMSVGTTP